MASHNAKGEILRNICIMAHVDHGKTTLADALIASNGIISQRQAGSLRYMDSRPDEMERGITMKSSCITLAYKQQDKGYLINLVDSPGHVDFSSEVSTAVRLCDGCILVVDVVEGVCAQTKAVMRQAWVSGVKPVLLLNKLDRLIREKELEPLNAYYHIAHVLEQVNAYMGELYNTDVLSRTNQTTDKSSPCSPPTSPTKRPQPQSRDLSDWSIADVDDSDLYFSPTAGNVVFASAVDGWGFSISHFADVLSTKLGMSHKALSQTLWGDFYITNKAGTKCILKGARGKNKKPLFVTLILENIYHIYSRVWPVTADVEEIKKIAESLKVQIPMSLYTSNTENKARFRHLCSNWLPLSDAVLGMVVQQLPPPTRLSEDRGKKLLTTATHDYTGLPPPTKDLLPHFLRCATDEQAPLIVYVSKMFGVARKQLRMAAEQQAAGNTGRGPPPRLTQEQLRARAAEAAAAGGAGGQEGQAQTDEERQHEEEAEELLAFARVFSGTLRPGQEVYVLGPKHDPSSVMPLVTPDHQLPEQVLQRCPFINKCKVGGVYLLLGREVKSMSTATAGMLVGISGLTGHIIKSGSLSSTPFCPPFTHVINSSSALGGLALQGEGLTGGDPSGPILRVQVLPKNPRFMGRLREGLKLLNQADPCVQVWMEKTGEYMVGAAGEVHLQRCLTDLEERYARIPINASAPMVPFRETIIPRPKVDNTNEAIEGENVDTTKQESGDGSIELEAALGRMRVRALPLPASVTSLLFANSTLFTALSLHTSNLKRGAGAVEPLGPGVTDSLGAEDGGTEGGEEQPRVSGIDNLDGQSNVTEVPSTEDTEKEENTNNLLESNSTKSIESSHDENTENENVCDKLSESSGVLSIIPSVDDPLSCTELMTSLPDGRALTEENTAALAALQQQLSEAFKAAGSEWAGAAEQIWSVGPNQCGPNLLLNRVKDYSSRPSVWQPAAQLPDSPLAAMDHGLVTGFQLCSQAGPMCEEPLMGVCFVVEEWTPPTDSAPLPPGKVIALSKELFMQALAQQPRRMMVAMYNCSVSVSGSEMVGSVYRVIHKRNGKILHGDITEGSTSWNIAAHLPIVESLDFANELRKTSSGEAQPQLTFSHWEVLEQDPFWDPCTAEELKHFGEKADTDNLARQYMNSVRKRKGIKEHGKKLVEFGEKQRTLKMNK